MEIRMKRKTSTILATTALVTAMTATAVPADARTAGSAGATDAWSSATTPGPSPVNLNQDTVASYMGPSSNGGTYTANMVNGLNHYVGQPDFNYNYYMPVDMDYSPTASQRSTFISYMQFDLDHGTPTIGRAMEVAGGPHLVGHPVNENINHYFAIGGHAANAGHPYFTHSAANGLESVP